jgi:hypothetical protein
MTNRVWPVDAVAGAPSYTGRALRQTQAPLLFGATAARPLGARSGVRPGTSSATVTATSTVWTVKPHAGIVDLETAAEAGPYAYAIDADVTGAVTAANATNPRKDIVYVQLDDPAESDGSTVPAITPKYLAGTAAATPAAPATPARSMVLAEINVPVSGGGSPTVVWKAPRSAAAGGIVHVRDATDLATLLPYASAETPVYADQAGTLLVSKDGSTWQGAGPRAASMTSIASAISSVFILGTGYTWRATTHGDLVTIEATRFARTSSPLAMGANTDYFLVAAGGIPAHLRPVRDHDFPMGYVRTSGGIVPLRISMLTDGSVVIMATSAVTMGLYNPANAHGAIPATTYSVA